MNALMIIFFMSILSLMTSTLYHLNDQRVRALRADGVASSITQIARSQHRHRADNPGAAYFSVLDDPNVPGWSSAAFDAANYATAPLPGTPDNGFLVRYTATDTAAAARVAQRFGPIACVGHPAGALGLPAECGSDSTVVSVFFARSLDLTLIDEFLPLNGERAMWNRADGGLGLKVGGRVNDAQAGTLITPEGDITTNGGIEGRGLLNIGLTFADTDNDGEIDPGERVAGEGILITSDGVFHLYDGTTSVIEMNAGGIRINDNLGNKPYIDTGASIIEDFATVGGGTATFDDIIINP